MFFVFCFILFVFFVITLIVVMIPFPQYWNRPESEALELQQQDEHDSPGEQGGVKNGGSFNDSKENQTLFRKMITATKATVFIETGTWLGVTTEFIATQFPTIQKIYTVEVDPKHYKTSRERLKNLPKVKQTLGDSTKFLESVPIDPNTVSIIFLDAHSGTQCPLPKELKILNKRITQNAIIAIDDFKVPNHPEFRFDDCEEGGGKIPYDMNWIGGLLDPQNWSYFYRSHTSDSKSRSTGQIYFYHKSLESIMSSFYALDKNGVPMQI